MEILIGWLVLSGIVGLIASGRNRSFIGWTLLSLLLSPLIGLVILLVVGKGGDGQKRAPCWQCKEQVVVGASKCPHCGADLVWNQPPAAPAS